MKHIIAFLAGAAVGAVATYLYFNNKIENIVAETVNTEMEKFFKRQEEMTEPETVSNDVEPVEESEIPDTTEKTSIVKMDEIIRTNYCDNDGIGEDEDDDEEYITDEEMKNLLEVSRQRMTEQPHIISEQERDTCVGYDCVEYTWYPETNILVDTLDHEVEDPDFIFAPVEWREALKDKAEITIRDSHEATDYTIYNNNFIK